MKRRLALLVVVTLAPAAGAEAKPPRVLVYSGTVGFHHESIPVGNAVLARLARATRAYSAAFIDKPQELTAKRLARSDIVLWNNTTGAESPFTRKQERAYVRWVSCGGGHIGVHASADSYRDWPAWAELTGAFFRVHGPVSEARILVENQSSAITLPWRGKESFMLEEELYAWDRDPAQTMTDFRPMLAFGGFTDPLVAQQWDHEYPSGQPLAWTGSFRHRNRIAYTNLGHSAATWHRGDFQDSLRGAIRWVGKKRPKAACLSAAGS